MSEVARHYCGQPVLAHGTDAVYGVCEEGVEFALADYVAARVASAAAENAELRSRIAALADMADRESWSGDDYRAGLAAVLAPAHDEGSESAK